MSGAPRAKTDQNAFGTGLSSSLEDYLEAIYCLSRDHGVARASHIAKRLKVSKSSVTGALRHLSELGFVDYDPYQFISLTREGERIARDVVWRHKVLKRFLFEVLNVEDTIASEAACRMEHAIDKPVLDRLLKFIQFVNSSQIDGHPLLERFSDFCHAEKSGQLCRQCRELAELRPND